MFLSTAGRVLAAVALALSVPATAHAETLEGVEVTVDDVAFIGSDELVTITGSYRCTAFDEHSSLWGNVVQQQPPLGQASGGFTIQAPLCDGRWHPFAERTSGQIGFFRAGPAVAEVWHSTCTMTSCSTLGFWTEELLLVPGR